MIPAASKIDSVRRSRTRSTASSSSGTASVTSSTPICGFRTSSNGIPDSPERHEAWRLANDLFGLTIQLRRAGSAATGAAASPRLIDAGERLEREALAGCVAHSELVPVLAEMSPDHFDNELHRRLRANLVDGGEAEADLVPLIAELDARAAADAIDEATGKELLLRLRERKLRRELADADPERTKELQEQLEKVRAAVGELV